MVDKIVDKVVLIMKQPEKIRNIAICAHIDHGKCVAGDSLVFLNDGRFILARDLFDRHEHVGKLVKDSIEKIIDIRDLNIETLSFNKSENRL